MRILNTIGNAYPREAQDVLKTLGIVDYRAFSQRALMQHIDGYDAVIIGLGLVFDKQVLERAKNLKAIVTATTGLDHIDVKEAEKRGIKVLSLRGETKFLNTITGTAELAAGLMIDLFRRTPHAFDSVKRYEWNREAFRGHNLCGQTLGIVGLGRLGRLMARYGEAFGMRALFCDPNVKKSPRRSYKKVTFRKLLEESDVISVHIHLDKGTEGLFSENEFKRMKNTACLINTARGKIVDEKALLAALTKKEIAGYAADVLADELSFDKRFKKHPLVEYSKKHDNCIIVPHIGGMTEESRIATDVFMARKLARFLKKEKN